MDTIAEKGKMKQLQLQYENLPHTFDDCLRKAPTKRELWKYMFEIEISIDSPESIGTRKSRPLDPSIKPESSEQGDRGLAEFIEESLQESSSSPVSLKTSATIPVHAPPTTKKAIAIPARATTIAYAPITNKFNQSTFDVRRDRVSKLSLVLILERPQDLQLELVRNVVLLLPLVVAPGMRQDCISGLSLVLIIEWLQDLMPELSLEPAWNVLLML
ncbi:hypothetical protein BGX33_006261 [Mortierella sp. NVP41]|nr:hypothetical protein BGX33_006261 [Mortierella sp. NVP41]